MTTTKQLAAYQNGNCSVTLFEDGSKTRSWEGEAKPLFPESIDLKITDYCDAGCAFCHESSTREGAHASLDTIYRVIKGLPRGVELAIGGGNPLIYPHLISVLTHIKEAGLIANITANAFHLNKYGHTITYLRDKELIKGLGISIQHGFIEDAMNYVDKNTVIHVIAGVHHLSTVKNYFKGKKILVLGYKRHGRGLPSYELNEPEIELNLAKWRYWVTSLFKHSSVSFDNLALKQLNIKDKLTPEYWEEHYMGDDGKFTMYVDAVKDQYAVSSTAERHQLDGRSAVEVFKSLHP